MTDFIPKEIRFICTQCNKMKSAICSVYWDMDTLAVKNLICNDCHEQKRLNNYGLDFEV